jgi:hypothetical protein
MTNSLGHGSSGTDWSGYGRKPFTVGRLLAAIGIAVGGPGLIFGWAWLSFTLSDKHPTASLVIFFGPVVLAVFGFIAYIIYDDLSKES